VTPAALADLVRSTAVALLTDRGLDVSALPATVQVQRPRRDDARSRPRDEARDDARDEARDDAGSRAQDARRDDARGRAQDDGSGRAGGEGSGRGRGAAGGVGWGEFSTNVALQWAGVVGVEARELAGWLAAALTGTGPIEVAEVAGPGFVNVRLSPAARAGLVAEVLAAGADWGTGTELAGTSVELVFAVAEPVSPVPADGARTLAAGDAVGRLLAAQGAAVTRVYLADPDGAAQHVFADSLIAAALGEPAPEGGQAGSYVSDIAASVLRGTPSALSLPADERHELFRRQGTELMLTEVRDAVAGFGVAVDRYAPGPAGAGTGVLVRGADGAELLPGRGVRLIAAGRPVRVSERAGAVPSIEDLVGALGVDAARYALARAAEDRELDLDLDLWAARTPENPVFAVQYAHSRLAAVARAAAELGIGQDQAGTGTEAEAGTGTGTETGTGTGAGIEGGTAVGFREDAEVALIGGLAEFPGVALAAAKARQPHRIAHHLESVARDYDDFAQACPVLPRGDEEVTPVHEARTRLCAAARLVIASGLDLLGVGAPERL
jgi:arginyl-tRNA synthetase